MNDILNKKLTDSLSTQLDKLEGTNELEDEVKRVDNIVKLWNLAHSEWKYADDIAELEYQRELDKMAGHDKKKADRIDKIVTWVLQFLGIVGPLAVYVILYLIGIEFESTDSHGFTWVKNLIGKVRPTK